MRVFEKFSEARKQEFYTLVEEEWNEKFWIEIEKKHKPKIFLFISKGRVVAGLAMFEKTVPDSEKYGSLLQKFSSAKVKYLGYLVVDKNFRSQGIGSLFLQKLFKKFPHEKFWLAIEDPRLQEFYEKNGFHFVQKKFQEIILER